MVSTWRAVVAPCVKGVLGVCAIAMCSGALHALQQLAEAERLADQYVRIRLEYDPALAYDVDLPASDDMHLPDHRPAALRDLRTKEDALLEAVRATATAHGGPPDPLIAILQEELESRERLRICRTEYWDISHLQGWQIVLPALAARLPAATPGDQDRLLRLWSGLPQYLSADRENLRTGLASGYSVPRPVVERVLRQ